MQFCAKECWRVGKSPNPCDAMLDSQLALPPKKRDLTICCRQHSGSMTVKKANRVLGIIMMSAKNKTENLITSVYKFRKIMVELERAKSR